MKIQFKEEKTYVCSKFSELDGAYDFSGFTVDPHRSYTTNHVTVHNADRVNIELAGWQLPVTLFAVPYQDFTEVNDYTTS